MSVESAEGLIADRIHEKVNRNDRDLEDGLRSRSHRSETDLPKGRFWHKPQFKKYLVYAVLTGLILLILFTITAFIVYEIMQVYGLPYIYLTGNLTGDALADLGTVGLVKLKPHLGLNVKVSL